ncbi:MAG: aldehyde dehydrogenase family protein [Chloroflexota bacterium]|nr:aldehyde dehydrogenase family protein [Chloroflexota bacterium]
MLTDDTVLTTLSPGMPILWGGNRFVTVPAELAAQFRPGDRLVVADGELLHIPASIAAAVGAAIDRATAAFLALGAATDAQITAFYEAFARRLEDDAVWAAIAAANAEDVQRARERGRPTTRLAVSARMRADMIAGLRLWRDLPSRRGHVIERIEHEGWTVEQVIDGLGVVGFVFEGRPNVLADATGVLRSGNTAVFRIGSDALGTARAMMEQAVHPAIAEAGLPAGVIELIDSADRAAGWALFSDTRIALAVARGSGPAVAQLGAVARQHGIPVSLHGTGGAWLVADETADPAAFAEAVYHSLDRKVCNTLNVCAIVRARPDLVPVFLDALRRAGERRQGARLHVVAGAETAVPPEWFQRVVTVSRPDGPREEPLADIIPLAALSTEWEWDETPEVSLVLVESVEEAIRLFNQYSPRFIASLVSARPDAHAAFYRAIEAPFVGNGFTRWVDGQYALRRPELGLSNWQYGRLFSRGGILSGDGVFTIRTRAFQHDPSVHR